MSNDDITPVRQQYLDIKKDHPNTILFFRLGDFYETFDEDAEITAAATSASGGRSRGRSRAFIAGFRG